MKETLKNNAEKIRFVIVGVINTALDFGILFTLVALGLPAIASNFVSTSVAMTFSFFANKNYTFKSGGKSTGKQVVLFLAITIVGLWAIQPIIIQTIHILLGPWFTESCIVGLFGDLLGSWFKPSYLVLFIGKVLATIVSLIWNYVMYRRYVFTKNPTETNLQPPK